MGTSASGLAKVYTAGDGSGFAGAAMPAPERRLLAPAVRVAGNCALRRTAAFPARESVIVRTHAGSLHHAKRMQIRARRCRPPVHSRT